MDHASPCFSERPFRSRPEGTFGNSLADSVSFRFPFRSTLGGAPLFQQWSLLVDASPPGGVELRELGENGITATVET